MGGQLRSSLSLSYGQYCDQSNILSYPAQGNISKKRLQSFPCMTRELKFPSGVGRESLSPTREIGPFITMRRVKGRCWYLYQSQTKMTTVKMGLLSTWASLSQYFHSTRPPCPSFIIVQVTLDSTCNPLGQWCNSNELSMPYYAWPLKGSWKVIS